MSECSLRQPGLCLDCNYPLHGIDAARCPECGRAFDVGDATTMNMGPPVGAFGKWILGPIGWPAWLFNVGPMLWLFVVFREPGPYYIGVAFVPVLVFAMAIARGIWAEVRMYVAEVHVRPYRRAMRTRRGALLAGAVLLLCTAIMFEVPLRLGFAASRGAMERLLQDVRTNPEASPLTRRCGLYTLTADAPPDHAPGIWRLYITGSLEEGFAFSEQPLRYAGVNAGAGGKLSGNWYWFSDD